MQFPHFFKSVIPKAPGAPEGHAERPLRWLLAASIVLPILVFAIGSIISYRSHMAEARDRLARNLSSVHEHALKVFETFELTARYLDEMLSEVTDQEMRAAEPVFHMRLKSLTDTMPQLTDLWIIDAAGRPVVAGTVFPMPPLDLSDREYFRVHKNNVVEGTYIGEVVRARTTNTQGRPRFFALSRKRLDRNGEFAGVTTISISPDYFVEYYSRLPQPGIAALVRADGAVLARFPEVPGEVASVPADGAFVRAIAKRPEQGSFDVAASRFDGAERIYVYRKLPRHGVYVVTGVDKAAITKMWLADMSKHLIFGVPATLAMFSLGLIALRRTRRESAAYLQLRQETTRREVTEQALRQAQKMEAVGRLTGGIAHDFNNLLTAILGNIDLALRRLNGGEDERIVRSLTSARRASERAAALVGRLLAFSRQHPLEVKAVDVNRLVQGMSELLRQTIGETVTIETVLAGGMWKTAVDPNQLENAVLNLAVNARDAMPNGGRLTIETANAHLDEAYVAQAGDDLPHGQYVMLAVTDSGTGMSKELMERAVEPFFTTKPVGAGSGLGLSMVYGFVKQSGGHIKLYSEPGEGTTVKLYFPRLADQSKLPDAHSEPANVEETLDRDEKETILLVEDDEQVNLFASEALRDRGYRVLVAADGPAALRILEGEPAIDLLFTDVVLPGGMNGRQLADEVLRRRPSVRVLFATGYTRNAIIHQGRLDPDVELLSKPFTADVLARKVKQVLDDGAAPARARETANSTPSPDSAAAHDLGEPSGRLADVRAAIAKACRDARREPASVTLVAISKTFGAEAIEPVIAAGQRVFGENRVQEAKAKWPALKARHPDIDLHLVGSLQSNKAKEAVALFDAIHSVDRPSLAQALAHEIARQGRSPLLFVEVNTGAEPQKAGVLPGDADGFLATCRESHGLVIAGLMCIPPANEPPAPHFALTAKIAQRNGLKLLSMGMSADFPVAIAFGATHVRVGTAIFGSRA